MAALTVSWRLRDLPGGSEQQGARPDRHQAAQRQELRAEPAGAIVCAACRAWVTGRQECIERDAAHTHTFLNAAGMLFRIRCFARAPGTLAVGERSDHWTWFAGFHWQACVCRTCFEHLGWCFDRPHTRFYGLIAERVLELTQSSPEN